MQNLFVFSVTLNEDCRLYRILKYIFSKTQFIQCNLSIIKSVLDKKHLIPWTYRDFTWNWVWWKKGRTKFLWENVVFIVKLMTICVTPTGCELCLLNDIVYKSMIKFIQKEKHIKYLFWLENLLSLSFVFKTFSFSVIEIEVLGKLLGC